MKKEKIARIAAVVACTLFVAGLSVQQAVANLAGCSNCIEASDIDAGAVRASELNNDLDDSITRNDIATGGVGKAEIGSAAVGLAELVDSVESNVVAGYNDIGVETGQGTALLTLPVPAGKWVIFAKLWLHNNDTGSGVLVSCSVTAGANSDTTRTFIESNTSGNADYDSVHMQVVAEFTEAGNAVLSCNDFGLSMTADDMKVIAIRANNLTNTNMAL